MKGIFQCSCCVLALALLMTYPLRTLGQSSASHGRLEEMAAKSDLVFKGRVISTQPITNNSFPPWGTPHATQLKVISVLKGNVPSEVVTFQHNTSGPMVWSGGIPPPHYVFETGRSYLIFAEKTEFPDAFRQLSAMFRSESDGMTWTLDARSLVGLSIKEAHWQELNRLLTDQNPTNTLYAIQQLNALCLMCGANASWRHSDDFKRSAVLKVLLPFTTNRNDEIAISAIRCFGLGGGCATNVIPYAAALVRIADNAPSVARRISAIASFSGTRFQSVSNAMLRWSRDSEVGVREQAVLLLPDFPGESTDELMRRHAADSSPIVRAAVADTIGSSKREQLLPTLVKLLSAPVGLTNPVPPLRLDDLQAGGTLSVNVGDVHTSAGHALVKFDVSLVGEIIKTNLHDEGFRLNYLCKLAEKDARPWLKDLVRELEARRQRVAREVETSGVEPKAAYLKTRMYLSGTYFRCWNIICEHLKSLPFAAFADRKLDYCLNELEAAGNTGGREPVMLYELYRMKGLNRRATKYRKATEQEFSVYGLGQFFDKIDARYPLNGAIPDQ